MRPLLFALILHLLLHKIKDICKLLLHAWYLDDGTVIGDSEEVAKVLDIIKAAGPGLGLELNIKKTKIFWPSCNGMKLREGLFPVDIQRPSSGVKLLGGAVSKDKNFISGLAMRRAVNAVDLMSLLPQLHDPQRPIPGMTPVQALMAIQTTADHSQKWHDGSSRSRHKETKRECSLYSSRMPKLLGRDMKKLKENVHAIQVGCQTCEGAYLDKDCPLNEEVKDLETKVKTLANEVEGRTNNEKFKECKTNCTEDVSPLYTPFYYSPEEIEYFSANSGFSNNEKQETDDSRMAEAVAALEATLKKKKEEGKKEKQNVNYYVDSYEPLIPFLKRLEHHAEEALVHQTMESLKKIKINRPLLKEIRQTDNYAKQIKDLVENKPRTEEYGEIRMNPRCSALLQNHLPPKEQDPGTFILPCSIGKLDFKNALADLGASISVMPFSMYKLLGIGKLEPINMVIEMANNTKCTPKGIVENLLIKIDRFIFPIDFVILDMVEDIRMPIILGRPLLATAHAKVDIFRKSISLEVGSEKVIFKMRSSFTTTNFECVRSIKSETLLEDEDFKKIDYELFLYNSESCEFNREILQEKENERQYWASCNPSSNICDGGDLPINIEKHYWESNNDSKREELEWENLSLNDWMRIRYGKVCKMTGERILKDYQRERFEDEEDDLEENLEDPEECREDKANTILGVIHDKLNNDWFNNTSEDEDDLEGILDYLKPRSYDGFIDLDDETYNKRRCRLLGMTYEEPTPIIIKVTRYIVGPGETYIKLKLLGVEKIPRIRDNVVAIRAGLMKKMAQKGNGQAKTFSLRRNRNSRSPRLVFMWDQVSILAKDKGFGHEMHKSEESKAVYGVTPPKDYAVTYSNEEMSHHTLYGVKPLLLYAATFKFTRDDLSESALRRNIGDKVMSDSYGNGDYDEDPYDDDMYEGQDLPQVIQAVCNNLDIRVRGRKKK
ncbi:hypothetical protein Tco_0752821 [Tanacetum coccineum]|uniref:Reverse transcriptase domain-containing protein n=1 Tax=Tanacetum coccineum TaxID=301880 RepID=A0ABQ4Z850_9ASTR